VRHGTWLHLNDVHHKSLPLVCVSVCVSLLSLKGNGSVKYFPPFGARQRLGKHVPAATNTRWNRRIIERVIFYTARVLSKDSLWVCLCIPLPLLGKTSVKTFSRQQRILGGVVFYAVHVLSKENRRLVLPTISSWFCHLKRIGGHFSDIFPVAVTLKNVVLWDVTPYFLTEFYWHFRRMCSLHLQNRRIYI
jgi:hypothetical protein